MKEIFALEISFCELRSKTVVNLSDGRKLGRIIDLVYDEISAKVLGLVVPGGRQGFFRAKEDIFIPYHCICKIGEDTILVELGQPAPPVQNNVYGYAIPQNK